MNVRIACATCKKKFSRPLSRVHESENRHWRPYCSKTCRYKTKLLGAVRHCGNSACHKTFYRPLSEIRKVKMSFCSHTCSAIMNNTRRPLREINVKHCGNLKCSNRIPRKLSYCSSVCFNIARITYQSDDLIKRLHVLSNKLGRSPAKRELGPIAYNCIRTFGSWNKASLAAGLVPHRSDSQRMFKRTNTTALDGHKCDSISEAIVDNWLSKNGVPHVRNARYPNTGHKADWAVESKIFIEYFGLANDSPRYDESICEKRKLCKKHRIKLIEIYPKDLYPVSKLEDRLSQLSLS